MLKDKYGSRIYDTCIVCATPLGTPPALYIGKYEGLCKTCSNSRVVTLAVSGRDGAKKLSYYAHAPAWRKTRDVFIAYVDCPDCQGKGYLHVSRSDAKGGSYPRYCKTCFDRYYNEPLRVWASARLTQINNAAQAAYTQMLREAKCLTAARKKKCNCPPNKQLLIDAANRATWTARKRLHAKFAEICKERNVWWDNA